MERQLRLAFLGDIHGNLPALEVVLEDIDRHTPDAIYLLGDLINRCPWTLEVLDILRQRELISVQGNHDLVLALLNTPESWPQFQDKKRFSNVHWTWEKLRPADISYLLELPHDLLIEIEGAPPLRLFHGLPGNPFAGILPDAEEHVVSGQIEFYDEPVLICGHTHQPLDRTIEAKQPATPRKPKTNGQQRILNPGSVGMPYNGDPRAHYLLLDLVKSNARLYWQPHFQRLEYNLDRVTSMFQTSGLLAVSGAIAKLNLRAIQTGLPWASDYLHWVNNQPQELRSDPETAVNLYLQTHGPDQWSFSG